MVQNVFPLDGEITALAAQAATLKLIKDIATKIAAAVAAATAAGATPAQLIAITDLQASLLSTSATSLSAVKP